jgi:hypothetical protein
LYTVAMGAAEQAARALQAGDLGTATTGLGFDRVGELLAHESQPPAATRT